ncbi:MAG: phosphoribosylaminoimidazolesuccinocarboxamide synthase [Anaerolineae bacterium]|nr:phosphoribosylaminoimidazolesuccinocarboxamide synthase [Anaerolineae bacterium]
MQFGSKLAEGKTKIVYAHPTDPAICYLFHKDGITAGDGARRSTIVGKGALAGRTTANVFRLLAQAGIPTHFVDAPAPDLMLVRRCTMIPLEVVMRRIATGSYLKRHPEVSEGTRFDPLPVEFFLKDDARHDPQVTETEIARDGIASAGEVETMAEMGRRVFAILEQAWAGLGVQLVDMKIEFGREASRRLHLVGASRQGTRGRAGQGALLVADVIDNDSWRLWPGGDKSQMLDKQIYRNMKEVTAEGLEGLKAKYAQVAELTGRFV